MLTGTDEHGMKIQKAAENVGVDTKIFCDETMRQFELLTGKADMKHDRFIRTTDQDHIETVAQVWRELDRRGYIYQSDHQGWYSISDETFYPATAVHLIRDPATGKTQMVSIETGKEVEWTSEKNYHFELSAFQKPLLDYYKQNPQWIMPRTRMNHIVKEVESGLEDLSISRPATRLKWGIPVPGNPSQTVYVWLDALMNYLTQAGYPPAAAAQGESSIWPPNLQVIGKDIIRFHCIYWPAFLMALDLPLPKQILTHAHWTMNRAKMSKSAGNVVNPFYAIDRFGVDTMRHYMIHDGGILDDSSYDNAFIIERYKTSLQGKLGNLVSRIMRGKRWDVYASVKTAKDTEYDERSSAHRNWLIKLRSSVEHCFNNLDPRMALQTIMDMINQVR